MPCSCGNTTCLCGIPCCCSEESCKCHACAIALDRFCKVCNKPLITDIQTDKYACSCFIGESTSLTFENQENSQCRMGNVPMPVGCFAYAKLTVNVMIPVLRSSQFLPQTSIGLMSPPSVQTASRNILPTFISDEGLATTLCPGEDSGIHSTAELHQLVEKSNGQSSCRLSSSICSTDARNTEISCKESFPSLVLQSTDERKTAKETEGRAIVQEPCCFYLPSIRFGDISYPVGIADPVWRLPHPFCIAGKPVSSLEINNPFYVAGPVNTIKEVTTLEKECRQPAIVSNGLVQTDSVTALQMNGQSLDLSKITEKSYLEIHGERLDFESSLAMGNGFTALPLSANSNAFTFNEQWKRLDVNTLPPNEMAQNYLISKMSPPVSTEISFSGVRECLRVQPQIAVSTSAPGMNDFFQARPIGRNVPNDISTDEMWQNNAWNSHQIPSTQIPPKYSEVPNAGSKLKGMFHESNSQSSEETKCPQNDNHSSFSANDMRNEGDDSIPLYIDTYTTRKMDELLKSAKYSSFCSQNLKNLASYM